MKTAVTQALAATNGGPGLTVEDLAARLGIAKPIVRHTLAALVFTDRTATCGRDGRYKLGDPKALLELAS